MIRKEFKTISNSIDTRICQCRRCNKVFNIEDIQKKKRLIYGIEIVDWCCPDCAGEYRVLCIPKSLDKYLKVNQDPRYYQ